jgi:hypothetical protein
MGKTKDLTGQRFGKLVAVKWLGIEKHKSVWRCRCDCGNMARVPAGALVSGNTKSCGCMKLKDPTKIAQRRKGTAAERPRDAQRRKRERAAVYRGYCMRLAETPAGEKRLSLLAAMASTLGSTYGAVQAAVSGGNIPELPPEDPTRVDWRASRAW